MRARAKFVGFGFVLGACSWACGWIVGTGDAFVSNGLLPDGQAPDAVADARDESAATADAQPADAPDDASDAAIVDAASATESGLDDAGCPIGRGPSMVRVTLADAATYCVDSTEVSQVHYFLFRSDKNKPTSPPECSWKTGYAPATAGGGCTNDSYTPLKTPNLPVVCVDECDALVYCAWAGKHLCGRIGGTAADYVNDVTTTDDEWFAACSAAGTLTYPYGATYAPNTCVDSAPGSTKKSATADVGATAGCVGGFAGVFDMSGNASEWENACDGSGQSASCRTRGGSFMSAATSNLACAAIADTATRDSVSKDLGFRCCY